MAQLKTKVILPFGTTSEWMSGAKKDRVMQAGEIGIVSENGTINFFEGTGHTFSGGVNWIQLSAVQIMLSGDMPLQTALEGLSAQIAAVTEGLSDYYTKSETSSATEIAGAFSGLAEEYQPKGDYLTAEVEPAFAAVSATFATADGIGISYDSDAKKIYLAGGNGLSSEIDASAFIKDGMLSDAFYDSGSRQIVLSFNTDSGADAISVGVGDLVDVYTAAPDAPVVQLSVDDNQFSAGIVEGSITPDLLSADAGWIFDCN